MNLNLTDAILCAIARALFSSVDLLLISNMLDVLSLEHAIQVMEVLKQITVDRKVACLATENDRAGGYHKPKTVIISTKTEGLEKHAHTTVSMKSILREPHMKSPSKARRQSSGEVAEASEGCVNIQMKMDASSSPKV